MANLPSIAQRINDIEVAANAPLTESLMRKKGSDINLLLDFLGITDGSTSATGLLSDFLIALATVDSHTISLEAVANFGAGTVSVGTYSPIRFVNRVFWARNSNGTQGFPTTGYMEFLMKQIDGGPLVNINAARVTPGNTSTSTSPGLNGSIYGSRGVKGLENLYTTDRSTGTPNPVFLENTKRLSSEPRYRYQSGGLGTLGYENIMREGEWTKMGVLSWREFDTSANIFTNPITNSYNVYMSYEFDLSSKPLLD